MSEQQPEQPKPAKFKGRFGNNVSQFGGQDSQETKPEEEKREDANGLKRKDVKMQTAQDEKTVGRTIRFPPDLHRYLKAYAGLNGRDVSDLVVEEMQRFQANHPLV